jgi:hypothetical protein
MPKLIKSCRAEEEEEEEEYIHCPPPAAISHLVLTCFVAEKKDNYFTQVKRTSAIFIFKCRQVKRCISNST